MGLVLQHRDWLEECNYGCTISIVGLPDLEVRESRERVRAALQNCGFDFPVRRITVNLAPADLPKESGRFVMPSPNS